MRNLERNKRTIYYTLYMGLVEAVDDNGYYTGEKPPQYSDPVAIKASVSAARGSSDVELFGINANYTNTIIVDDMDCPVDEHSLFWIDENPYAVVLVAKSLNHIAYAVRKLDANEALRYPQITISA